MRKQKQLKKRLIIYSWFFLGAAALFTFILTYIAEFNYVSIMDALFVTGFIIFFFGWMFYVTNVGLFDATIYTFSRFFKAMVNKQPKMTLEERLYSKKQIGQSIIVGLWLFGLAIMAASGFMYLLYYV